MPSSFETVWRIDLVFVSRKIIFTFGATAPWLSVTMPEIMGFEIVDFANFVIVTLLVSLVCDKDIHNISEMTHREAQKLLFQSKEKVCIRMERESDGRIKTLKKQFHHITRQIPIAAGVLTASLILSAVTHAQDEIIIGTTTSTISTKSTKNRSLKPIISGIVTDSHGAVVPNVKVILRDTKTNIIRQTVSNDEGIYEFKDVETSVYEIKVAENNGFKQFIYKNLTVAAIKI